MEKPEEIISPIQERVAELKKILGAVALAIVFGGVAGGTIGYSSGKSAAMAEAEARLEKIQATQKFNDEFAAGAKYYHLCWSFRQLAAKDGRQATRKNPAAIEMNEATAQECSLQGIPNVKPKIVF